jgi:hypothetical protein
MPSLHEVSLERISSVSPVSYLDRFLCTSKPTGLLPPVIFQLTVHVRTSVSSGCARQTAVGNAYAKVSPIVVGTKKTKSCWKRPKVHSRLRID